MNMHSTSAQVFAQRNGAVIMRARPGQSLGFEEIAARAPSVFADDKHESRSAKYTFIDTAEVLTGLVKEGFEIVEVRQGGSRTEGKSDFTKHQLILQHRSALGAAKPVRVGDYAQPQISLRNAHDGTSAWRVDHRLMRLICLNGMTTADEFEAYRVPHKGDVTGQVIEGAFKVVGDFERIIDRAGSWAGIELNQGELQAFASAARELRFEGDNGPRADRLLQRRRAEDRAADLWTTMNVVQENLIRGGQSYQGLQRVNTGRDAGTFRTVNRTTREVRSIDQDTAINRALWTLTEEMRKLKQAA